MWLKVLMPKGTFHMFCHLLDSIGLSKYTWLEVQKYRSAQVQKSLEVHNLQTQMVGYQAKPDSTWHFVTGHRCYSGRSHVPPLSNIVITCLSCVFLHVLHLLHVLPPCLIVSLWSLIPVLHIFKSARQSLHAIGPIMLQPLNMFLMKDSFSPQEFYFLHSDVGKRRSCGRPTWKIVTTHLCIHGRLWASFQFFHVIFQDILHSWGPRGTIGEFSYNCDVDTNSSQ